MLRGKNWSIFGQSNSHLCIALKNQHPRPIRKENIGDQGRGVIMEIGPFRLYLTLKLNNGIAIRHIRKLPRIFLTCLKGFERTRKTFRANLKHPRFDLVR